jgi:DNA-binding LacI/PurR family transcriptional regulator
VARVGSSEPQPEPSRRSRPTSADVARAAGVSRATVSYVLNDTPHQKIPESTRHRVLEAAAHLDYLPSAAARALRTGRSEVVLLLLPDWPIGPAVADLLETMSAELARAGMTFVAHPRAHVSRPVSEVWRAIAPAAVIAFDELDEQEVDALRTAGVKVVVGLLTRSSQREFEIAHPQQRIGRRQVEHLAGLGHRRVGYASATDPRVRSFVDARVEGARAACAELGLEDLDVRAVPLDPDGAAEAVGAWRTAPSPVTAVCAYNDETGLALLAGLRRLGLAAPEDLAVIGVDDIPVAALSDPPLTTVVADQRAVAEHAVRDIVAALEGRRPAHRNTADLTRVVRRGST